MERRMSVVSSLFSCALVFLVTAQASAQTGSFDKPPLTLVDGVQYETFYQYDSESLEVWVNVDVSSQVATAWQIRHWWEDGSGNVVETETTITFTSRPPFLIQLLMMMEFSLPAWPAMDSAYQYNAVLECLINGQWVEKDDLSVGFEFAS